MDRKTEEEFAGLYPGIYNAYRKALDSKDPNKMLHVADLIEKEQRSQTPWYSLDIIPGTDADMFENLSTVLTEESKKYSKKNPYDTKSKSIVNKFKDADVKAKGVYGQLLKEYDAIPNDDYINKLDKSYQNTFCTTLWHR
jgi:hypothetical protein